MNDVPDPDTLGGRISRARDAMALTTAQLARRLGVKSDTVAAWESDRSEPRANRLIMLAGVLGVSPTWLLNGMGEAPTADRNNSALRLLELQINKLEEAHTESGRVIANIRDEFARIARGLES